LNTNLRQFPNASASVPVKLSKKAAAAADAAEQLDVIKINQLTCSIYAISFNEFFKNQGFTMDHLAAAALSVATQHMSGVSEAGVAHVKELYESLVD
jgi:hypothetical protein